MLMVVKTYKSFGGRASRGQWSNSYEIETENAIGSPELDAEADTIVTFEKQFHTQQVHFMRVVVSTFAQEGDGHPEAVRVRELSGTGTRIGTLNSSPSTDVLPTEVVLELKRVAETGRTGRILLRGCLTEGDVSAGGNGNFILHPTLANSLNGYVATWNDDPEAPNLVLASYGADGAVLTRPVSRIEVGSVIIRKRTSRRKKKVDTPSSEFKAAAYISEAAGIVAAAATFYATRSPGMSRGARTAGILAANGLGNLAGQIVEYLTMANDNDPTPIE